MPITPTEKIWMDGDLVDWPDAKIHVLTHTLHYGTGVFEGIRAYEARAGTVLFRAGDHLRRLHDSAQILGMRLPYTVEELLDATKSVVRASGLTEAYVRPLAYYGYGEMGLNPMACTVNVVVACWTWPAPMAHTSDRGARLKTSSWMRLEHNAMPPAAKATGNYINSAMARVEALRAGYDEAIMLNRHGVVAECSAENVFGVRNGVLTTPPTAAGALDGITRDSILTLAADLGIPTCIADLTRSDLYIADEVFTCGTSAEVVGVSSVDDRPIRYPGRLTGLIATAYAEAVRGRNDLHKDWLTAVAA